MQDSDPSKTPAISATTAPKIRPIRAPKATLRETREMLALALAQLHEATVQNRALQQRLRDVLEENRELRADVAGTRGSAL
jgi:hypothetical protein